MQNTEIVRGKTAELLREQMKLRMRTNGLTEDVTEAAAVTSIAFVTMAEAGTIDETTATEHISSFAEWQPNVEYTVGQLRKYGEDPKLYKCVQAHTSQADWTPDKTASLWSLAGDPADEWPAWSQPVGAHDAYNAGDKCSHNNKHWISDVGSNVWEPGVYGWTQQ